MSRAAEGDCAPAVTLVAADGRRFSPTDFKGEKLVLHFCPGEDAACRAGLDAFTALARQFEQCGTWVVAVRPQGAAGCAASASTPGVRLSIATDPDGSAFASYGLGGAQVREGTAALEPATFLLERDGTIERIWCGRDVPQHAVEALTAARERP